MKQFPSSTVFLDQKKKKNGKRKTRNVLYDFGVSWFIFFLFSFVFELLGKPASVV